MKRIFFIALIAVSCGTEKSADPGKPTTFIRYFNGGNEDNARQVLQTSDNGYIILATSGAAQADETVLYKIKLVKTDEFGNLVWQKLYPETANESFTGNSIKILSTGGYIIAGEDIQSAAQGDSIKLLVMTTDPSGNVVSKRNYKGGKKLQGRAVTVGTNGNFLVLSSSSAGLNDMVLMEINKDNLAPVWNRQYGAGNTTLNSKLDVNSRAAIVWASSVTRNDGKNIRFIETPSDSELTLSDLNLSPPATDEVVSDITPFGFGYALAGSNITDGKIIYFRLSETGSLIPFPTQPTFDDGRGNSVCATKDGGLVILGTTASPDRDSEYYIKKVDAFGTPQWTQGENSFVTYGSRFKDEGASVIAAADGSFVVLGTTALAGVNTLMLMKISKDGQIE